MILKRYLNYSLFMFYMLYLNKTEKSVFKELIRDSNRKFALASKILELRKIQKLIHLLNEISKYDQEELKDEEIEKNLLLKKLELIKKNQVVTYLERETNLLKECLLKQLTIYRKTQTLLEE